MCRSQWPRGLRRRSAAARLLRSWVRIPPEAWMFIRCECCVLSGRGLCDELITCPEESYRLWCVVVCDLETSIMRRPWPTGGCRARNKTKFNLYQMKLWLLCAHTETLFTIKRNTWNVKHPNYPMTALTAETWQSYFYTSLEMTLGLQEG